LKIYKFESKFLCILKRVSNFKSIYLNIRTSRL